MLGFWIHINNCSVSSGVEITVANTDKAQLSSEQLPLFISERSLYMYVPILYSSNRYFF